MTKEIDYVSERARERLKRIEAFSKDTTVKGVYHNFGHEKDVEIMGIVLGQLEKLNNGELYLLRVSALTHDIIVVPGARDNEQRTGDLVYNLALTNWGLTQKDSEIVRETIYQTQVPQKPFSKLGEIICDADVSNFGRIDFLEKGDLVRQELSIPPGNKWYQGCLALLTSHQFFTPSAKRLFDEGKQNNIRRLKMILEEKCGKE